MKTMILNFHCGASRFAALAALASSLVAPPANAALTVIGVQYDPDRMHPEFDCYWNGGNYPNPCPTNHPGATLHVYVKNTGASSATITDATLTPANYSLATVIKKNSNIANLSSIYYYWDHPPQAILDAGEPVWWKADPPTVPVGGVAQVAVRVRYFPTIPTVTVGVVSSAGTFRTNITVDAGAPRVASIGYSEDRKKVYLHWRRNGGAAPTSVWLDGTNVTSLTTTVGDPSINFAASVINLTNALGHFSYHVYQGVYADGKVAAASQRAWTNKFIYATYCKLDNYNCAEWLQEATTHGFNNIQMNLCGMCLDNSVTSTGYGYTIMDKDKLNPADPDMWFLNDEPDITEVNRGGNFCNTGLNIPCDYRKYPGTLVKYELEHAAELRASRPNVPTTVNLDSAGQPWTYYEWGPAVDILQSDAYYEPRMKGAYQQNFNRIPLYNQGKLSYAVGRTMCAGAEPNPSNHLLYSTRQDDWPYPDYRSKRFEVYYTLAGGSKGIGYWWLQPPRGMNNTDPASRLLWKEVGLCGNEIKTARDLIVRSTPVDLPLTPSAKVWVRGMASGTDSLILYVVNDNYSSDINGCHVTNVPNATVTVTLPSWMPSPMAFEVTPGGLKPVSTQSTNGNQLLISLGTLTLTRMIVLTKDAQIALATQQRYTQWVRPNVCAFASEYCTNSAPVIVVQPQSQSVILGDNPPFVVTANAIPLPTYQWRFNGANLSGATSASYTRTNAQASHSGGYSAVVSNSLGMVTSAVAALTVSTNGIAPSIIVPPQSQTVNKDANAIFTLTANGTQPLSYQWRFNGGNLAGATGTSYTRFNAQTNDAGQYAVVVTNVAGSITSAPATLTVIVPVNCDPVSLVNGGFEGGNTGGVATGWTSYEVNAPSIKVWSIQTVSPQEGLQYQQIQAYNAAHTASAGVRQNITGCVPGATYQIAGWYRSNSNNGRARVRVSPGGSTDWSTAIDLNPVADYGVGVTWATFSGTVVATGTTMTLWLDGRTIASTSGNVGCFDGVTVTCLGAPAGPEITQPPAAQNVCAGATATFDVSASGSGLAYQWQKNQANLANGGHYSGATTATLTVSNADANDVANYRCVVTGNGSTTSSEAPLSLKLPTAINDQTIARNVCPGSNTTFSILAVGDGTLTYQWQKNSANLNNGGHYSGATTDTLTITTANTNDVANYRCVVIGSCGSATSSPADLTLVGTAILENPSNEAVGFGCPASFSVAVEGCGQIGYRWQKNNVDLNDVGHYSGVTTSTLTVSNADSNDQASYRCAVNDGTITNYSGEATLTVTAGCAPCALVNADFEGGNFGGVASGWTAYQRPPNPVSAWSIQTADPPAGGLQYQQIANTSSTGGGGVRQDITGCTVGNTYTISGWMRGNSILYSTCTVKVSPTASTNWSTAADLNPPQAYTGSTWTPFSGTVVATGTSMTLWLDGQTGSTGENKAECFDSITVNCEVGMSPLFLEVTKEEANLVFRWPTNQGNYNLIGTTNLGAGAVWSAVPPPPTVVNGTNIVTNAISGERKFYRLMHQ